MDDDYPRRTRESGPGWLAELWQGPYHEYDLYGLYGLLLCPHMWKQIDGQRPGEDDTIVFAQTFDMRDERYR
jgi:hypothetical protein